MRWFRCHFLVTAAALALTACGGDDVTVEPIEPFEPKLSSIQTQVFDKSCAFSACHDSDRPALDLDLTAGAAYAALVGRAAQSKDGGTLVAPSNPEESFLVRKLRGELNEDQGGRMPLGNVPLAEETLLVIETWIANGAIDD